MEVRREEGGSKYASTSTASAPRGAKYWPKHARATACRSYRISHIGTYITLILVIDGYGAKSLGKSRRRRRVHRAQRPPPPPSCLSLQTSSASPSSGSPRASASSAFRSAPSSTVRLPLPSRVQPTDLTSATRISPGRRQPHIRSHL